MSTIYGPPPQSDANPDRGDEQSPEHAPVPSEQPRGPGRSRTFFGERGTPAGFTARAFN